MHIASAPTARHDPVDTRQRRRLHLVILAHLWLCVPLFTFWLYYAPGRSEHRAVVLGPLAGLLLVLVGYLAVRTLIVLRAPQWLRWDFVFPLVDVALVSAALYARGTPESALHFAYLIPVAEAVGTLSVTWAAAIGTLSAAGFLTVAEALGGGTASGAVTFRVLFVILLSTLLAYVARHAADLRAEVQVARDRERIAAEMHDGIQGQLAALSSRMELAQRVAKTDLPRAVDILEANRELARQSADGLRFLVHRLRTPELAAGFVNALRQYVHSIGARDDLDLSFEVAGEETVLPPEVEHAFFRIVQEALCNVVKHAEAQQAVVHVLFTPESVQLSIKDDGRGFESSPKVDSCGMGLESMRARAEQIGATLRMVSKPGHGTEVTVTTAHSTATPKAEVRRQ